ncbi:MAG: C25 family cysteine peptidase [bacterium]
MKKYIWLLLLIITYNLSSQTIDVKTENDLIKIKINSLSRHFLQTKYSNYDYLKFRDTKHSLPYQKGQYLFDEIQLIAALPDDSGYKLEKKFFSKRMVSNHISYESDFDESVTIQYIGKQRGISVGIIKINPFRFEKYTNSLFIFDSIEVLLRFEHNIPISNFDQINPEYPFFSEYINKQHLPELLKRVEKEKGEGKREMGEGKKEKILSDYWYEPELQYVKLTTKNDGIAKANAEDLISAENSFAGKNINYFHLLFKGEEIPISFNNDSDAFLNAGDEIIFLGHRGEGDTTWFNNYSDYSAYFLYYDESQQGLRFSDFPNVTNATNTMDYVNIQEHIEYEKIYLHGDFNLQDDIENIHREGWLWQEIGSGKKNKFLFDFLCLPAGTIQLDVNLLSVYWNHEQITKHNLSLVINNDTLSKFAIDTGSILKFRKNISVDNLVSGINNLTILNIAQRLSPDTLIIPNDVGIDYIELNGSVKPLAIAGRTNFSIEVQKDNFKLNIPNFKTSDIFLLDKNSSYLSKIQGQQGTNIIAGTKSGKFPWSSIIINDSTFSSELGSMNIGILKAPDYKILEFRTFTELNNQVVDFINEASAGSIIAITYNSTNVPSPGIISKLQSLGSNLIAQVKAGDTWTFIVKTDDISHAVENITSNGISNSINFIKHNSGKSFIAEKQFKSGVNYDISACDINAIENALVEKVNSSQLKNQNHRADAIFITHNKFQAGADSLANYRRGQGYEIEVVDIEDIYKEFKFGIKSAHAIKSFLQYANKNWQKPAPQYLLLIGDANWSGNKARTIANVDYIPSYGWPVSDFWYVCLDSANDYLHDMYVGRIPASEVQHVFNVLNKNKEYDTAPKMSWMKKLLSLTGGGTDTERENFKDNMDGILYSHWMETPLAGDTMVVAKKSSSTVGVAEANEIISKIDAGAIWVTFYGHGAPNVFDMDGWHSEKLNNKGKYSFFTTISCNTAAFAEDTLVARNEDYLTIADKGFIATGGSSNFGADIPGQQIVSNMLDNVTDTNKRQRSLGEIVNNAKINMIAYDPLTRAFAQQFVLLGDPMTKIRIPTTRDIYTVENEVKVTNIFGNTILIDTDSNAIVSGFVFNNGYCENNNLSLRLIHKYKEKIDTFSIGYSSLCTKEPFLFDSLIIYSRPGIHEIEIIAELTDTILEIYKDSFEVFKSGLLALDPLPYWNKDGNNLHFRFINPVTDKDVEYEFYITSLNNEGDEKIIYQSKKPEINILENCIDWLPDSNFVNGNKYFVYARYVNQNQQIESDWLRIPFYTDTQETEKVKVNLNNEFLNDFDLHDFKIVNENGNKVLRFNDILKNFQLISAKGNSTVDRYCEIVYDDEIYIYTPSTSNAPVGINLIVVSGKDGKYIATRKYNTWDGENSTRNLVTFLNDSVETGDWLLLSSCGGAWRMFYHTGLKNPDATGSFKTFKEAMAKFGSQAVNEIPEINDIPQVSFAFAGRKEIVNSKTIENIAMDGSQITAADSITIFPMEAVVSIPVIFTAKKWENCKIDADIDFSEASTTLSTLGFNYSNSFQVLDKFYDTLFVDLSFMDSLKFPGIGVTLQVKRFSEDNDIKINNFEINFSPSPELAMVQSQSMLIPDTVMRGESSRLTYKVENLSLRSTAEDIGMLVSLQPEGLNEIIFKDTITSIAPNNNVSTDLNIETLQLKENNLVTVSANYPKTYNELYTFNNSLQRTLHLRRDNDKPFVKIFADGVEIHDSSYVSTSPFFEIELYDYSFEPVLAVPEPIRVRINSVRQTESNAEDYKLELINKDDFKAVLGFLSDTLFDWDNRIEVIFQDAAGNVDTVEYHIFTSLNAIITNPQCEPNPINENANITFSYKASDNAGTAVIAIYDVTGRNIKTLRRNLVIGKNELEFDGYDVNGNSISQGVYLFLIKTISPNYSEPVTGKFVKLR